MTAFERIVAGLALAATACGGPGAYVWFTDLPPEERVSDYVVGVGDVLAVRVVGHEEMTTRVRVRGDGRIAIPFLGEIAARGKHADALRTEIETGLKAYFNAPNVTLNVEETLPTTVALLGEVAHPGVFPLGPSLGLSQALALGGGVTEFASRDRIFIVRTEPKRERIRFTYEAVLRDEGGAAEFALHPGDVVVVE